MTPESFQALADALDEALLLLSSDGVVCGANHAGILAVGRDRANLVGCNLSELTRDPGHVDALLRAGRRTTGATIGAIQFDDQSDATHVVINRLRQNGDHVYLLMRVDVRQLATKKFSVLTEKLELLNAEIAKRRVVEIHLRRERDNATFGRDVGIALVNAQHLDEALARCTDLMVERLNATFARIWLANEEKTELKLVASSGLYTHLDGDHSRIRFGEFKIGRIAQSQQPHVTNQVIGDSQVHDQAWARREGMVSFVGYPLVDEDSTVGVMALFSRNVLSDSVAVAVSSIANSVALRIRKQMIENDLAKHASQLQEADRRKDEFLAMLSHELRNPLAPLRTGLDLLSLESDRHGDTIQVMQQQVAHLVRLVDDLLDVSRIMRGNVELRKQPVEIATLIRQAVETLHDTINNRQHRLRVDLPEQAIWVDADGVRIIQVIENLLNNACKYTDRGGEISIRVCQTHSLATIEIVDSGVGIDQDLLGKVFDLFTQADRSIDRSEGGLGIGLTLVKNLVEMHGGQVTASSDGVGFGSQFKVELPTCSPMTGEQDRPPESDAAANPLRILIVDDNRAARVMLSTLLQKLGPHTMESAEDGKIAIEKFEQFRPHLMLLDIGLPKMNGYEVSKAIRLNFANRQCLLVALTGYGQQEDRKQSREAGFDIHLVKPISVDQLRKLLRHPRLQLT